MKIALVAQGRFHAFDYAREMAALGHTVGLATNYPTAYVTKWGVPRSAIRANPLHGAVGRALRRGPAALAARAEPGWHRWFGRWAARTIGSETWDAVVCWSGVGEEVFSARGRSGFRVCHRLSTHIRTQDRLLEEEGARAGRAIERPSPWMLAREEREYELADVILVPSTFARRTFLAEGVDSTKVLMVPFGVDPGMFRPSSEALERRCRRIEEDRPLSVAYVGSLSLRKGLVDLLAICRALDRRRFEFHLTGPVNADAADLVNDLRDVATIHAPVPQHALPDTYAAADLFVFPTIEDGYAYVLSQALQAGLPVLASAHCAAPDIVEEGVTGWTLPARRPDLFVDRLEWCDTHRSELADMVRRNAHHRTARTWRQSAAEVITALDGHLQAASGRRLVPAVSA